MKSLFDTLRNMNRKFGKGDIEYVTFRLNECNPGKDEWYGTVSIRLPTNYHDVRFFKVVDGVCIFLSRKRKVK